MNSNPLERVLYEALLSELKKAFQAAHLFYLQAPWDYLHGDYKVAVKNALVTTIIKFLRDNEEPIAIVINNNQPGWTNIIETKPNVTLDIGTYLYTSTQGLGAANWLSEILAVIHSDGGHHQLTVGNIQATTEAIDKWYEINAQLRELKAENEKLRSQSVTHDRTVSSVAPAGYKLVPIEPTEEIIKAIETVDWSDEDVRGNCINSYYAAIAAASTSPIAGAEPLAWIDSQLYADLVDMLPNSTVTASDVTFRKTQWSNYDKPLFRAAPTSPTASVVPEDNKGEPQHELHSLIIAADEINGLADTVNSLKDELEMAELKVARLRAMRRHYMEWSVQKRTSLKKELENVKLENEKLQLQLNEAQKFKRYVHARLDEVGVPHDPMPENTVKSGCRIEGRLLYLISLI